MKTISQKRCSSPESDIFMMHSNVLFTMSMNWPEVHMWTGFSIWTLWFVLCENYRNRGPLFTPFLVFSLFAPFLLSGMAKLMLFRINRMKWVFRPFSNKQFISENNSQPISKQWCKLQVLQYYIYSRRWDESPSVSMVFLSLQWRRFQCYLCTSPPRFEPKHSPSNTPLPQWAFR